MKRLLKIVGCTLLVAYLVICVAGRLVVNPLIFFPPPSTYKAQGHIQLIDDGEGGQIAIWEAFTPTADYVVLYSHGNAEDLGEIAFVSDMFVEQGFSFVAYDYSGYGLSSGKPTEENSYKNIETVYAYLTADLGVAPEKLIVMGNSIGSGASTYLAAEKPVGGLILQSAFTSIYRVVTKVPIFFGSAYPNLTRIQNIGCPLLVIHGRADQVIPFAHGEQLFARAKDPKVFYPMADTGHNEVLLFAGEAYWAKVNAFMEMVQERSSVSPSASGAGNDEV